VGSKFSRIVQLSPPSLKIIPIWSLNFFQFDFDTKVYFYYFSIPGLEEERERLLNSDNERENPSKWLFLIFTGFMWWDDFGGSYLEFWCCLKKF